MNIYDARSGLNGDIRTNRWQQRFFRIVQDRSLENRLAFHVVGRWPRLNQRISLLRIDICRKEHHASDRDASHIRADFEFHICSVPSLDTDRSDYLIDKRAIGVTPRAVAPRQALLNEGAKGGILGSVNRIEEQKILSYQNGESCAYWGGRVLERLKMAGLNEVIGCKRNLFSAGGSSVNVVSFTRAYSKIV
jgi:hypothetical protein